MIINFEKFLKKLRDFLNSYFKFRAIEVYWGIGLIQKTALEMSKVNIPKN